MSNSPEMVHRHCFEYSIFESEAPEVPPQRITLEVDGEAKLPQVIEMFERYLIACGFVPPDNTVLDWVPKE